MDLILSCWMIFYILLFLYAYLNLNNCNLRLPITYFMLSTIAVGVTLILRYLDKIDFNGFSSIILLLGSIGILFLIAISPKNSIIKFALFTLFLMTISISLYPVYLLGKKKNINLPILITISSLFLGLSICAFYFPQMISPNWGSIIFFSLIGLIFFRLGVILTGCSTNSPIYKYTSYFAIILFCVFILYDTKFMVLRARNCQVEFDYINNILNLFLDLINLFTELVSIKSR